MFKSIKRSTALAAVVTAVLASTEPSAWAAGRPTIDTGDTAWLLVATALVLMMNIPGLSLFYAGMVRKKNVLATAVQAFAVAALVTVLWFAVGYSLAFTDGNTINQWLGGLSRAFGVGLHGSVHPLAPTVPENVFLMYQATFAIITPAIIAGAFAERMKFSAMMWFMGLWLLFVYVPVTHWVWGGGFLGTAGVLDFAGGLVVHLNAGIAGLVCALVLGRREGYGHEYMAPHNLVLTLIGTSLLWVGWFGFNAGSALSSGELAGDAMLNTHVSAAVAALVWMAIEWGARGKPSVLGVLSGAVAGLGTITPAAGYVEPWAAMVIGLVAGAVCYWASVVVKTRLGYDDSLDVFGVHGVSGIVGSVLVGVFATRAVNDVEHGGAVGLVDGRSAQVLAQLYGVVVIAAFSAIVTWAILKIIDVMIGLRVTRDEETEGLDTVLHGERVQ
ncbi:ammonium transporter [Enhydrobacter aerosaccus]|uniref:Ammonium transporter n=1 Tax=Enhydrobacter aerosaccus TaxID=225324 RepID=A0A1T4SFK4_9HYPH|nr:ammonium transporter [Enhydrobacter aerosaccus]SKA26972.1 ammonium transporter [Enhydrobacter aerosaccus]